MLFQTIYGILLEQTGYLRWIMSAYACHIAQKVLNDVELDSYQI